jgi:hypothetical protein
MQRHADLAEAVECVGGVYRQIEVLYNNECETAVPVGQEPKAFQSTSGSAVCQALAETGRAITHLKSRMEVLKNAIQSASQKP